MKRTLFLSCSLLLLSGCLWLNPNALWGTPKPCIITSSICGVTTGDIEDTAGIVLKGSYSAKAVDEFLASLPLTPDQQLAWESIRVVDQRNDRWVQKNLMDLWAQMWWRSEDDNAWKKVGYKNN